MAMRPHWPLGQPHCDTHDDEKREGERDKRPQLPEDGPVAGQRRHRPGVLAHRNRNPRAMGRVAEVHPRKSGWRDRYRADCRVIVLSLETLEDFLHLRDRYEMVLASEGLRCAAPQIDAEAVNRTVGLDMAVRSHVVDRDLERRVLSRGETGEDEVNDHSREAPNESRGGQRTYESRRRRHRSRECDSGLLRHEDETRVATRGCGVNCRRKRESSSWRTGGKQNGWEAIMNAIYVRMERFRPYTLRLLRIVVGV